MDTSSNRREDPSERKDSKDRLSELPDEVLVHILSFLPIVDAVRTVLIRTFGNLWTLTPSLDFDGCDIFMAIRPSTNAYKDSIRNFVKFVNNVLLFHKKVTIDTFKLPFNMRYIADMNQAHGKKLLINAVSSWLSFAIDRKVKHVEVINITNDNKLRLLVPQCVFTSQSLVTLRLDKFRVVEPLKADMGSLRKLLLYAVEMSNEVFSEIIQGCPSLQEVMLHEVTRLNELRITAPNIQKLSLSIDSCSLDCPNLKNLFIRPYRPQDLQIVDLSSIREVDIMRCEFLGGFYPILEKLCHAEILKISDKIFKSSDNELFEYSKFNGHDFPLTRWKRLHIESRHCNRAVFGLHKILRSSPHLEELVIHKLCFFSDVDITCDIDFHILKLSCPMLKNVTIRGFELRGDGVLGLAELLLKSSVVLEKMVIRHSIYESAVDVHEFRKKLVSFQRASTNARVIFGSSA